MPETLLVFELLIPRRDDRTGLVHPSALFDAWVLETAARFGGITQLATDVRGLWFDQKDLVQDVSNSYRVAVAPDRTTELRQHVREAARRFGQRCLYFQWSGEAELVYPE